MKTRCCGHLYSLLNPLGTPGHLGAWVSTCMKGECGVTVHSIVSERNMEYSTNTKWSTPSGVVLLLYIGQRDLGAGA